jgi:hypothetical protein
MSYLAKSLRPSDTVLRLLLAYFVLTSALPVHAATAQSKAKATSPAHKSEQQTPQSARAPKDRVTPSALQANGKIAFVSDRNGGQLDIYLMNPDGSSQTPLTTDPADDYQPNWSPDGRKIVFTTTRDGSNEIYLFDVAALTQARLTNNAEQDFSPVFSPEGDKIAFVSTRDGNDEIYLMNADGSGQIRLTNNFDNDGAPAFSPDGSKIVFETLRDGNSEVYVMNPDGSGQANLSNSNAGDDGDPSYSPDGSRIAFVSSRDGDFEVYAMNADGTAQTRLTSQAGFDFHPSFSPDASKIVFKSERDGDSEIYLMNASGTGQTRLTNDPASEQEPAWQTLLSCTPPPPNGVAWYRAQENAQDSFGTNHGTLQNGAGISQGFAGDAFNFDGVDDVVDIGQLTDLQNAQELTVMAWVKKRDLNNTIAGIVGKWNGCTGCVDDTFLLYNSESVTVNKGGFVVRFTDDTAAAVAGATDLPVGQWVHIAATWRSFDGEIKIYKNGRLDGAGTGGAGKTLKYHTNYTAKIGEWGEGHGGNPLYRFGGNIDEATIYSRALSQAEIKNVYDAKNAGQCFAGAAQTITASNTNDSGPGSLRQAILDANASPGTQTIAFNIPGAGVHTINLTLPLPDITDAVVIDGYTQPGSRVNTLTTGDDAVLLVELNGTNAGAGADGLRLTGNGSTVRGLVINRFNDIGIVLNGSDNNIIEGNFIGTDPTGLIDLGNGDTGIKMESINADNNFIGGTALAARNIISGNNNSGIEFEGSSTGNTVQGNFIGLAADGTTALGNFGYGVLFDSSISGTLIGGDDATDGAADGVVRARNYIAASNLQGVFVGEITGGASVQGNYIGTDTSGTLARGNGLDGVGVHLAPGVIIGGATPGAGNLISANGDNGISISNAGGVVVKGNRIGTQADGVNQLGNASNGIYSFFNAAGAQIGGPAAGEANVIAFNASNGVSIDFSVTGHAVSANSIHSNGSTPATVGIDLGFDGVTPNDANDPDAGANNLQNFPVLSSAAFSGGNTNVTGTLNSTASTSFRVEFFSNAACDASGNGEGRTFLGSTNVTTDGSGNANINTTIPAPVSNGEAVTATATDPAGNTSEFSPCQAAAAAPPATNVSWINPAGGAWNVASNWLDSNGVNRVPAAGDDAIIDLAGTYTVTLASPVAVNTINLGAASGTQTLDTVNFALTLADSSFVGTRGVLVVNGTLNGAGNLNVGGALEHRGTLSGAGTVTIVSGATLNITGSQPVLSRTLNNAGTANYAVANSFVFTNGTFNNLPSGLFNVQVEKLMFQSGGSSLFVNQGTVRKATGTGTTTITLPFNNNGTVDLLSGALDFNVSGTSAGQFNGAAGTTLGFNNQTLTASSSINVPTLVISGGTNSIAGTYNVNGTSTINGTVTITGNVLSVGNLLDINGRVDFNSNNIIAPTINVDGTLAGSANVTTTASGTINYNATMLGTGTTNIPAGATLNITGSQPQLQRTLNNSGTANYNVVNSMVVSNGTFNNLPGAVFNVQAEKLMFQSGGPALFSNTGTVRKLAGTGTTIINVPFNNNGTVELQSGTLTFGVSGTSGGTFNGAANTDFIFVGHTLQAASSVSAPNVTFQAVSSIAGSYNVSNVTLLSGTTTFTGNVLSVGVNLTINGQAIFNSNDITAATITVNGILNGSANVSPTANGTFNFNGTMSGTGATNIPAGATLNIGGSQPTLSRTLNNSGTTLYNVSNSLVFASGTFNNLSGGVFDARADKLIFASGGTNIFNNAGTLEKTQGAGATNFNLNLSNTGTVESKSGTLGFNAVYNQSAGTTRLNGGDLSTSTLLNIQGGTLSGTGTITGNVQNAATLAPGLSPGVLNINGNYTQLASGTLAIEIGGTSAGAQYDQLNVSGTATLAGALDTTLINSFNPGFNDAFVVLTYGTRSGTFGVVNGASFTPAYNANNLTLLSNAPPPSILSVTNTNDSGAGSLRQAIIDSNNTAGLQSINFQIPVAGVQTITPASPLPQITDAVVIDGYTQPNASANTLASGNNAVLLVELNGANAGAFAHGLDITVGGTTVRGLVINRFGGSGVNISGQSNNIIEGNFIGTDAQGASALANNRGVDVANSQNNRIGGATPAARNLLSGNSQGVQLFSGATGTLVQGNFIGTTASGTNALPNTLAGLLLNATGGNTVGGTAAGAGNVISGNATGIFITQSSSGNVVQGNLIGTASDPVSAVPNTVRGIFITQGSNGNTIGGAGAGAGNTIAFNAGDGIVVDTSAGNNINGNSIHSNAALGLDLLPAGITPNDANDTDSGSNNLQNFPVLTAVTSTGGNTTFSGTLASAANTSYALHFYSNAACDSSGNGEGQTYLGTTVVVTDASGDAAFDSMFNGLSVPATHFVTATATDLSGNTSEFGACRQATAAPNAFTISGQILDGANGLGGVTVTLGGSQTTTTTTDAGGNYSFAGVASGGNYVVTPSLANYTFAPASQAFNNLSANQTANFNATLNTHTISGQVAEAGNALAGVTITLSGSQSATAITDAFGNYAFNVSAGGNYTVTPALANYTFNPSSAPFNNLSSNATANFSAARNTHSIGGNIRDNNNNAPLAGVAVNLSGGQTATTTTDASGNYSFTNLPAGANYTVTPTRAGYSFIPPNASFNNLSANATANFNGAFGVTNISGRVVSGGAGLGNVTLYVTDANTGASLTSALTDANGNYVLMLPPGGDYTITTAKAGFTFQPAARSYTNLNGGQTSDFTATRGLNISGRVAGPNGNGIGNVNVTLSGSISRTTLTLPNGSFLFTNLPRNGNYVLQADSGLLTFSPPQIVRPGLVSDLTLNVVAAPRPAPVPTPPIEDDFNSTTRDPLKFTEGTLTQPPGSQDLLVSVVQEGGKLKITPRADIDEASFNGYVSTRSINFNDAQASVEVNQTADNGAQTIFAVGRDERNFFRFVAQDLDDPPASAARSGARSARSLGLRRLIFQVRNAGVLNGLSPSIAYDPVQHRYWRFRHSSAESAMFFETSPDRVVWTEQRRVALGAPIGALAVELGAGTSGRVSNPGQAIFDNLSAQPSAFVNRANNVRLAQSSYRVSEGAKVLTLKATRAGDTSRETQVDYATEPHDGKPCNTQDGKARARCDFATTAGTIRFAPGEVEKLFDVFITDDIYVEGDETVRLALGFPSAGVLEEPSSALITIADNDAGATPHPINTSAFFVRQQYLDFLNREPDDNGFKAWVGVLSRCAYEGHFGPGKSGSDPACDRITVSSSFFRASESQIKGYFVYRFYKASLGRAPTYEEFLRDMTSVTGQTEAEVVARREAFAQAWVERADFVALNEGITNAEFVDQLATSAGVSIANRAQLVSELEDGRKTRAQALRAVVDSPELFDREYNAAFVLMQYFGYLQRDPDETGYNGWLNLLNRTGDYRTMIFGFLYSQEYVLRFGPP